MQKITINPDEVEKFSKIASEWWDPKGKFAPLHKFNPARISYIRDKISLEKDIQLDNFTPFQGLNLLDIGCGGGLLAEPLSKLGFKVTAIDASDKNIKTAMQHAKEQNLEIDYRCQTVEELALNEKFDVILNMEVIEHVANPKEFIKLTSRHLKEDGLLFIATLNRSIKSLLFAKFAAEYVLHWLPKGTHDWRKFLKPSEINNFLNDEKLDLLDVSGFVFNLLKREWYRSNDLEQNYIMLYRKSA